MKVVVLGGGFAGLCASILLARDGHQVLMLERDAAEPAADWRHEFIAGRRGVPHYLQPHAFLPRGRLELKAHLPDVNDLLLASGALEFPIAPRLPGPARPGDDELTGLLVRRPLIEWALRVTAAGEPGIEVRGGVRVTGLRSAPGKPPRVTGIVTDHGDVDADFVVDALGRSSPVAGWLVEQAGAMPVAVESSDCGVTYYSRYFELLPDAQLPEGPWLTSPRGDLGYAGCATFLGDNRTFATNFAVLSSDAALKEGLRDPAGYQCAIAAVPQVAPWIDPAIAAPITPVMPMGGHPNTLRVFCPDGEPVARGVVGVADSVCHTNPMFALGLSYSLIHAAALSAALRSHPGDAEAAYFAETYPTMRERFDMAVGTDAERRNLWSGEKRNVLSRDGGAPWTFRMMAPMVAAAADGDIARVAMRRWGFLASLAESDQDDHLERAERVAGEVFAAHPPPPPIPRNDLLERMRSART